MLWVAITDDVPMVGEWVLATYYIKSKACWCTRIYQWRTGKHSNRKITHWCYIKTPAEI